LVAGAEPVAFVVVAETGEPVFGIAAVVGIAATVDIAAEQAVGIAAPEIVVDAEADIETAVDSEADIETAALVEPVETAVLTAIEYYRLK
jgi:hypothetical protein